MSPLINVSKRKVAKWARCPICGSDHVLIERGAGPEPVNEIKCQNTQCEHSEYL